MSVINFNIAQWRAWAPGLESVDDWQDWCRQPSMLPDSDVAPDVSFLPAMQRRRLSRLARMAFSVGWPLAEGRQDLPEDKAIEARKFLRHGCTPIALIHSSSAIWAAWYPFKYSWPKTLLSGGLEGRFARASLHPSA